MGFLIIKKFWKICQLIDIFDSKNLKNTGSGARTHDHQLKRLALYRLS